MMGRRAITGLFAVLIMASTSLAQPSLLQQATAAFNSAQQADKVLNEKPQSQQARAEVIKVINAYQRVYLITPNTSYADDALIAIARLYESISDKQNAIKTLTFLVNEYPQSPYKKSAQRDIATLSKVEEAVPAVLDIEHPVDLSKAVAHVETKAGEKVTVDNIRYWPAEKSLRVVVDLSGEVRFKQGEAKSPDRVYIDIANAHLNPSLVSKEWHVESGLLQKIRVGQYESGTVRVVLDLATMLRATSFTLRDPDRLIIDVIGDGDTVVPPMVEPNATQKAITELVPSTSTGVSSPASVTNVPSIDKASSGSPLTATIASPTAKATRPTLTNGTIVSPITVPAASPVVTAPVSEIKADNKVTEPGSEMASSARPTSLGNRTLIRSLGLKVSRVVIDAGHGGKDTGSIGPTGYSEKELVLDVAKRLKSLIETELGAEVVMTRNDDTFVPLETRTVIANQQEADLFISIHANSSKTKTVRGVETFFLNFTTSKESLDTASRENAGSEKSVHELSDLVKRIVLTEKVTESRELAQRVQTSMSRAKGTGPDRGVKQAPFVVLIGANMPSILAEISFISNPDEEKVLRTPAYRQHLAQYLLDGVRSYADTLSGVKTASSNERH
jgi:N-acetylmuramoyl-L-alanine amidase